ncbi:MAG: DNA-binding protein [Candidatus Micrarchaeia archaeon]
MEEISEETKKAYEKKIKEILRQKKEEEKLKKIMAKILDAGAYERLMNVKISNYDLYITAANYLINFYQRTGRKITEKELINLLSSLAERREGEIKFYRK